MYTIPEFLADILEAISETAGPALAPLSAQVYASCRDLLVKSSHGHGGADEVALTTP
jgi:hypothetical protein